MTIRTKLIISTIVQLASVIAVGLVLTNTLQAINRANDQNARATKINEAVTEMRFITFENLLNHGERSLEQWHAKYDSIGRLQQPVPADDADTRRLLASMTAEHKAVGSLFERLTASYSQPVTDADAEALRSFQERLAGQLLVRQQAQIAAGTQLAALSRTEIASQQLWSLWLVSGVILFMLIITTINALVIVRAITNSLTALQHGATALAAGNLGYRIPSRRKDEFGQIAASFNAMAASLGQIDQTKSEFIIMVSHQLRTPATAVKGFLALLIEGYMGRLPDRQNQTLKSAFTENERQIKLIDEMLVVAQAETGQMTLSKTPTNLGEIIAGIIAAQAPTLKERLQTVKVKAPKSLPDAFVDADKIRLVFENLLANASLYSPRHTIIHIELRQSAEELMIDFKDRGFGIAAKDQSKIFRKFSRLPNAANTYTEGAGLGLYLAKRIMDLHLGRISVQSEGGTGSTFTVHLPRS